jgi:hypothetical protein
MHNIKNYLTAPSYEEDVGLKSCNKSANCVDPFAQFINLSCLHKYADNLSYLYTYSMYIWFKSPTTKMQMVLIHFHNFLDLVKQIL